MTSTPGRLSLAWAGSRSGGKERLLEGDRACKRSRCSLRSTPKHAEPKGEHSSGSDPNQQHTTAASILQEWAPWAPRKEASLTWSLLKTTNGLWGGE